jgi:hypothetical protein
MGWDGLSSPSRNWAHPENFLKHMKHGLVSALKVGWGRQNPPWRKFLEPSLLTTLSIEKHFLCLMFIFSALIQIISIVHCFRGFLRYAILDWTNSIPIRVTRSKFEKSEFFFSKSENDQNLFLQNQKLIRKVHFLQTNWYYAKILASNTLLGLC